MKLDYNIINDDLWIRQGKDNFEIHYKDQVLIIESDMLPELIKGLRDFNSSDTRTILRLL